jgi:hypothetical protein
LAIGNVQLAVDRGSALRTPKATGPLGDQDLSRIVRLIMDSGIGTGFNPVSLPSSAIVPGAGRAAGQSLPVVRRSGQEIEDPS